MNNVFSPVSIRFDQDLEFFDFSNGLIIRKITEEELDKYFNCRATFKEQLVSTVSPLRKGIGFWDEYIAMDPAEILCMHSIPQYSINSNDWRDIQQLLTVLRLHGTAEIFCPKATWCASDKLHVGFLHPVLPDIRKRSVFKISDLEIVKSFWLKFKSYKNNVVRDRIPNCFDYWMNSKVRFVEAVSIAESILCKNIKDELRYRFALFGALVANSNGLIISRKAVTNLYDVRSKLVHTGQSDDFSKSLLEQAITLMKLVVIEDVKCGDLNLALGLKLDNFVEGKDK